MMKNSFYCRFVASIALALLTLLSACTLPVPTTSVDIAENAPISTPTSLKKVRLAISPFLSYAPFFIAIEEGFFRDEGLEIEIVHLDKTSAAIPALIQGDIDAAGAIPGAGWFNAFADDASLKIVADRGSWAADNCDYSGLVLRSEAIVGDALVHPQALRDWRIAGDPVATEGFYIERTLQNYGLTLGDVTVEDLPPPVLAEALQNGSVNLVHATEPWLTRLMQDESVALWKGAKDVSPDFQFALLVFGPNLLEKDRDTGERLIRAYLRGVRQYNEGKTDRNIEMIAQTTELDPDLLREACWPSIRSDGMINVDSLLEFQDWLIGKGYLDQKVDAKDFWDPAFAEQADR
ncbi:MAG: ABC transporter substrate-binding protein [Caldilineales bacterium]|nr:ABC transporter substrate-binding protein [Caldilineales bacterium]